MVIGSQLAVTQPEARQSLMAAQPVDCPNPPLPIIEANPCRFEGPEKMLEVDFVPSVGPKGGLLTVSEAVWVKILDLAGCQILSKCSNGVYDAYVLSESSLFVSENKMFLKTCGTITLLKCLPVLLEESKKHGMVLEWLGYSRKNYTFPSDQAFPHCSFSQEIEYTKNCVGPLGKQLMGGAYMLGDLCNDHYCVYVSDYCERDCKESLDRNINIMMFDLDPEVQKIFYRRGEGSDTEQALRARVESGIDKLVPDAMLDDTMFDPCGYSMNGLEGDAFHTIHITPEPGFSYASFETNLHCKCYKDLIERVLHTFKPKRFTIAVFADAAAFGTMVSPVYINSVGDYRRESRSSTCFKIDYVCQLANYVYDTSVAREGSFDHEASALFEDLELSRN